MYTAVELSLTVDENTKRRNALASLAAWYLRRDDKRYE
jgi:hypothetical protein